MLGVGFGADLVCFDVVQGRVLWSRDNDTGYGWGITHHSNTLFCAHEQGYGPFLPGGGKGKDRVNASYWIGVEVVWVGEPYQRGRLLISLWDLCLCG